MNTEKEKKAIERLKCFEPETESYYLCYSGGKDSDAIRILAALSGVRHELHYNVTTVDAPETLRYIKSIGGVSFDVNRDSEGNAVTMWNLIPEHTMPPTRISRYCCKELKEHGGKGRMKITGVRSAESKNREKNSGIVKILGKPKTVEKNAVQYGIEYKKTEKGGIVLNFDDSESRRFVEKCYRTTQTMVNPILDWSDSDVWEFLHHYGCEGNPLYQCGKKRIGCIGCPMSGSNRMKSDFKKYPTYKRNYIKAFDKMLDKMRQKGIESKIGWKTGLDVYKWWIGDDPNQLSFFEDDEGV